MSASNVMSGARARLARIGFRRPGLGFRPRFNSSGSAGPLRPFVIMGLIALVMTGVVVVSLGGHKAPVVSRDARMNAVDSLPGGLHSTPEQEALALRATDTQAEAAIKHGVSYTPPMWPSQLVQSPPPRPERAVAMPGRPPPPRPQQAEHHPAPVLAPVALAAVVPPAPVRPRPAAKAIEVAATTEKPDPVYATQLNDMFSRWGARSPRTDVLLPPGEDPAGAAVDPPAAEPTRAAIGRVPKGLPAPSTTRADDVGEVLIPAGRGIFAHPVLAVNSDASSPVVLQADSGPIAGDRMIGTFARQEDRLVIHISTINHRGEEIAADGLVIAPDTMEAGVATGVDQHYLTRFVLPAAAAFVAGLGQAIETTSNSVSVLSPLGGAVTESHLNLDQQLGVAAGAAASQVASTLKEAAPKGPTISLDANVAVGVMFLSNVVSHPRF